MSTTTDSQDMADDLSFYCNGINLLDFETNRIADAIQPRRSRYFPRTFFKRDAKTFWDSADVLVSIIGGFINS
jgi:hypothetical protein